MINLSRAGKRAEWASKTRLMKGFERALRVRVARELERVAKVAAIAFERSGHHAVEDALTDHEARLQKIVMPVFLATAMTFVKRVARSLGKEHLERVEQKDTEAQMRERVAALARRRARRAMAQVAATTKTRINRVITRGIEEGKPTKDIAKDIRLRTGGKVGEARAKTIAQTEVHSAANGGELETVKELGLEVEKEWVSMADELVRPDHQEANGDEVPLHDKFDVGGEMMDYPGDPDASPEQTVNCRCILVYNRA